jgi:hypothetical protein
MIAGMPKHLPIVALALALALALAGCGGGGQGEGGTGGPTTAELPPAGITIARTADGQGGTHVLSLELPAPALQAAMAQNAHFGDITSTTAPGSNPGAPLFVVNGDAAIGDWRFALDLAAQDDAATILVFKAASGSTVRTLAGQLTAWAEPGMFNADPQATQARLVKIVETAIANAADPALAPWYGDVAKALTDPAWNGVLVLNPSLTGLPAFVQARAAPGQRLAAHHLRIANPPPASVAAGSSVAGLIDYPRAPVLGVVSPDDGNPLLLDLRALFMDSALAQYEAQVRFRSPGG